MFVPLLMLAVALTTASGIADFRSWKGESGALMTALAALAAVVIVLLLGLAIGLRG